MRESGTIRTSVNIMLLRRLVLTHIHAVYEGVRYYCNPNTYRLYMKD